MNIATELMNFRIDSDSVDLINNGERAYFFRISPPNLSIMSSNEKATQMTNLKKLLNAIEMPFKIFITDEMEDLKANIQYLKSIDIPQGMQFMMNDILDSVQSLESSGCTAKRGFYIIVRTNDTIVYESFRNALDNNEIRCSQLSKAEITNLLRNYLLKEFVNLDIMRFETQISEIFSKKRRYKKEKELFVSDELTKRITPRHIKCMSDRIEQGGFMRRVLMVKNYPSTLFGECIMKSLAAIKNTTISMEFSQMTDSETVKLVNAQNNAAKAKFSNAKKLTDAANAKHDLEMITAFYSNLTEEKSKIYYLNVFIEVTGKTIKDLNALQEKVKSALLMHNITIEMLQYEQKQGFLSVFPLGKKRQFKSNASNMPSITASRLYPFTYSSHIDVEGIPIGHTKDGGNMFVDFFYRDTDITNGSFVILGESGFGKSTFLKKIISISRLQGRTICLLTPDPEYNEMFRKLGGTVIDCSGGMIKLNPFEIRRLATEDDVIENENDTECTISAFKNKATYFQHLSWLRDFYGVLYPDIIPMQLDALCHITDLMYKAKNINQDTDINTLKSTDYPTFTDLYNATENMLYNKDENKLVPDDVTKELLLMLSDAHQGSTGFLLNGYTNIENLDMIAFDLTSLLHGSKERAAAMLFNVMTFVWNRISRKENQFLFVIDELFKLCNRRNMVVVQYTNQFIKQCRKYEAVVGTATQQIVDIIGDKEIEHETSAIFNTPLHKFLFNPGELDGALLKNKLNLTDGEIKCLQSARKGDCLYKRGKEKYAVHIELLPYELPLFGKGGGR